MSINGFSTALPTIRVKAEGVIYSNPLPQLKSRKAYFPNLVQLRDGSLLSAFVLGEAMESVDQTTVLYRSEDEGCTWKEMGTLISPQVRGHFSDSAKLTVLPSGQLTALGYRFDRSNPNLPIGNPATGGLLPDEVFFCQSDDSGQHWTSPYVIGTSFKGSVEASAPLTVLSNGAWVAPIANFASWDGQIIDGLHGRLLRSDDKGNTWSDSSITMRFPGNHTAIWEQRLCEYLPGQLAVLAWIEDLQSGEGFDNQAVLSLDNGLHFDIVLDTGIHGQAANLTAMGEGLVLSLHCMRKGVSDHGILATVTDLSGGQWETRTQCMIWRPNTFTPNSAIPEVFSGVRFGQPSTLSLGQGNFMVVFWCEENGEASVRYLRLKVDM